MVARPPVARRSGYKLVRDHQQMFHVVPRGRALLPSPERHPVAHSAAIAIMCCVFSLYTVVTEILYCQNQYRIRIQW